MYPFRSADLFSPTPPSPQEKVRTAYNMAFVNWQASWVEMYRDQSFYLGNQWTPEERRYLQQEQRPDYIYNLTRPAINMIQGYQRKHRLSLACQPLELSSQETADQFTKCLYHVMRQGNGHYATSDAFKGALITGIGYLALEMDYRFDPLNGDPKIVAYPWNSIITDPFWTKRDWSDCDYVIRRAYMTKTEAISRFPKKRAEIERMQGNMRDELFTFLPEQRIFQSQNLLAYTEYWEQQYKTVKVVVNPMTLQEIEITSKNSKFLAQVKDMPGIQVYEKQKPVMKWTALLNNELIAEDENPYNLNEYPFIPIIAIYQPEYDLYQYKMQGVLRCIRDPQIMYNKYLSKATDYMDSQINTGWIVKKSKFDNPMDFYKTGQGRNIFAKPDADLMADARQIQPSTVPPGIFELQNTFNQLTMRIIGMNEELLASADDDKAGILSMLRQGAALVNLQDLFDGLRQSQEILGNKIIKLIQNNWTPEKIMRVTKSQPTNEFYDQNFGKYDAVCVEAPLTETQQQLYFQQLMQFKEMGAPIQWKTIMQEVPMQGKQEMIKDIEQAEQQQMQMAQAQMQAEMQDKAVVNDLLIKEANSKVALSQERLAKAEEDRAQAGYERAKAIKELDGIDMDNIKKFVDTIVALENAESNQGDNNGLPTNSP